MTTKDSLWAMDNKKRKLDSSKEESVSVVIDGFVKGDDDIDGIKGRDNHNHQNGDDNDDDGDGTNVQGNKVNKNAPSKHKKRRWNPRQKKKHNKPPKPSSSSSNDDSSNKNSNNDNDNRNDIGNNDNNNNKSWKERNKERDHVHPGSYASAEMRKIWGISLPELDESNTHSSSSSSSNDITPTHDTRDTSTDNQNTKLPKRKVALLLQFIGTNYTGMQINEGKRTIQAEIELALYKAGMLTRANFGFPKKYSWSNSARTDKGVHACAQVCSVKILLPTMDLDQVRERINDELPEDVNVGDVVQVPRSFCARTQRDRVGYQYMLPSFALKGREEWRDVWKKMVVNGDSGSGKDGGMERCKTQEKEEQEENEEVNGVSGRQVLTTTEMEALRETMRGYRVSQDTLDRLKEALETYKGTHKFHNYTRGKKWDDPSSSRYIVSFEVQDLLVDEHGIEWIPTMVVGQSFLLHQIRKMMCMAMDVARGATSLNVMKESFGDVSININTAPAQGLSLDMSYYEYFNKRQNASEPLDWHSDKTSPRHLRWKKFKEEKVMKHIMEEEWKQGNFLSYMLLQENHIQRGNYERSL